MEQILSSIDGWFTAHPWTLFIVIWFEISIISLILIKNPSRIPELVRIIIGFPAILMILAVLLVTYPWRKKHNRQLFKEVFGVFPREKEAEKLVRELLKEKATLACESWRCPRSDDYNQKKKDFQWAWAIAGENGFHLSSDPWDHLN